MGAWGGGTGGWGYCVGWHVLPLAHQFFCRRPGSSPHFYDTWPCLVWAGKKKKHTTQKDLDLSELIIYMLEDKIVFYNQGQIIEETVRDVPQQVRERGCWQQSAGECDWPGDTAQRHPLATSRGPREAQLSICSRCSKKGDNENKNVTAPRLIGRI